MSAPVAVSAPEWAQVPVMAVVLMSPVQARLRSARSPEFRAPLVLAQVVVMVLS